MAPPRTQFVTSGTVQLAAARTSRASPCTSALASERSAGAALVTRTVRDLGAGSGIAFEEREEHELKAYPSWALYAAVG